MLDVFGGPGFLAKASNYLGLLGYVLDTKFGRRYGVTSLLVLTRIRQDVSAWKCVGGLISPPRRHTACSPKIISGSAAIANLIHRARMLWLWDVPKIKTLEAQRRTACALADFCFFFFLDLHPESELGFCLEMWTSEIFTVLFASVLGQVDVRVCLNKNMLIQSWMGLELKKWVRCEPSSIRSISSSRGGDRRWWMQKASTTGTSATGPSGGQ